MMKTIFAVGSLVLAWVIQGVAQVPSTLSHQGRVAVNGVPFHGTGQFKFALISPTMNLSRTATAIAHAQGPFGGEVYEVIVTDGGYNYVTPPAVTITDASGAGSGAQASAIVASGVVVAILVTQPGADYVEPTVTLDPPAVVLGVETYWSNDGTTDPNPVSLPVNKGLYSVSLGDTSVVNMSQPVEFWHLAHPEVRLRIWFSDGVRPFEQLSPDATLTSVPYSLMAHRASGVNPGAIGSVELASDGASLGKVTGGLMTRLDDKIGIGTASPSEKLEVAGRIVVGDSANASPKAGTIRWTGKDFEGYNGTRWVSFSSDPRSITPVAGMVWIPAGSFPMGSPAFEVGRNADEGPQTSVTISQGFWMGSREVTQGVYLSVVGNNPSTRTGDLAFPVEWVTWQEAVDFCALLTTREKAAGRLSGLWAYRLPTEAEWEYAARAGTATRFSHGDDLPAAANLGNYAWYDGNWPISDGKSAVGLKAPNAWGLYDMYGNVSEWCWDWYGPYPGGQITDPTGVAQNNPYQSKVKRGRGRIGVNFDPTGMGCRSAARDGEAAVAGSHIGFRVVLSPVQF